MAERRMFAKTIIDSDAFLDLPIAAQALYFHLSMRADDDGFVNKPRAIMNMIGAKNDDMMSLINRKFVITFSDETKESGGSGVLVIKHWRIHNCIRADRYKETKYKFEKATLYLDENNAYSTHPQAAYVNEVAPDGIPSDAKMATTCIPSGNQMEAECIQSGAKMETQVRLGKVSLVKDSIENNTATDFDRFWSVYPKKVGKEAARKAFSKIGVSVDLLINAIEKQKQGEQWNRENGRYIPNPATWLNQGRWEDDVVPMARNSGAKVADTESFKNAVADFLAAK